MCGAAWVEDVRTPEIPRLLILRRAVPVASANPGDPSRLRNEPFKLIRELLILFLVAWDPFVVAVDVVDVELGVLGPLDVGLEEPMIVFNIALA